MIDRRSFLAGTVLLASGCAATSPTASEQSRTSLELLRAELGQRARLGVAALDTGSGRTLRFDAGSRYAMCSTFKLPLAAAILAAVDRGRIRLDDDISFGRDDLLDYAPVVRANLRRGKLPVERLCAAIVEVSDNSAANLLLRRIGGPAGLTAFIRRSGDRVTRLDRYEEALNTNLPGDPRDTTSPAAMADLARKLVLGDVLAEENKTRLQTWLKKSVPGADRLKAGLPVPWLVGHKTGTGARGAVNDVAVAWRSGKPPIVIACYLSGGTAEPPARFAAHAAVGRLAAETFG